MFKLYRIYQIDECNQLWVLDTGVVDKIRICPSQLLTFDLRNDRLIKRRIIPDNISTNFRTNQSLLVTPVIEYGQKDFGCQRPRVIKKGSILPQFQEFRTLNAFFVGKPMNFDIQKISHSLYISRKNFTCHLLKKSFFIGLLG